MPDKKLKHKAYITHEPIRGFYDAVIPKGTTIYPTSETSEGINHHQRWHFRFLFDTIKGAHGADDPIGNMRCEIWFTKGAVEKDIEPIKIPEE